MLLSPRQPFSSVVQMEGSDLLAELTNVVEVNPPPASVVDCIKTASPLIYLD